MEFSDITAHALIPDLFSQQPLTNHFSSTCKIICAKPRSRVKPAWFSPVCSSRVFVRFPIIIEASISDTILIKLVPLWLSQDNFDPFLYIWTVNDCDQLDGITTNSQILTKILVNLIVRTRPVTVGNNQIYVTTLAINQHFVSLIRHFTTSQSEILLMTDQSSWHYHFNI